MATLSSTGRFAAGEACADNDILYGPYATIAAAHAALFNAEQNVVGRTVGIQTGNTIEEYWYQGGTGEQHLVKKQATSEYSDLENLPSINGVTLIGDQHFQDIVDGLVFGGIVGASASLIPDTSCYYITNGAGTYTAFGSVVVFSDEHVQILTYDGTQWQVTDLPWYKYSYLKPKIDLLETFEGATASTSGVMGFVPAPAAGDQEKVLQGDGTWVNKPTDGASAYEVWLEENDYDEANHPVSEYLASLKGERGDSGQDAVNPFKGWYDAVVTGEAGSFVITSETQNLPANPIVGDYAYVKTYNISGDAPSQTETPIVKIYECTTAGSWSDSGRTVDTSNVQTFASTQQVNQVHILGSGLNNSPDDIPSSKVVSDVLEYESNTETVSERIPYVQNIGYIGNNVINPQTGNVENRYSDPIFLKAGESLKIKGITPTNVGRLASYNPDTQAVTRLLMGESAATSSASDAYENTYTATEDIYVIVGWNWSYYQLELTKTYQKTTSSSKLDKIDIIDDVLEIDHDSSVVTENLNYTAGSGYYTYQASGNTSFSVNSQYTYTDGGFTLKKGDSLRIVTSNAPRNISVLAMQDGTKIRGLVAGNEGSQTVEYVAPLDGLYFITFKTAGGATITKTYQKNEDYSKRLDTLEGQINPMSARMDALEGDVADLDDAVFVDDTDTLTTGFVDGYFIKHDGRLDDNSSFGYKEIDVRAGSVITYTAKIHPNSAAISKKIGENSFQELVPCTVFDTATYNYTALETMTIALCFKTDNDRVVNIKNQLVESNTKDINNILETIEEEEQEALIQDISLGYLFNNLAVIGDSMSVATMDGYNPPLGASWLAFLAKRWASQSEEWYARGGTSAHQWLNDTNYGLGKMLNDTNVYNVYFIAYGHNDSDSVGEASDTAATVTISEGNVPSVPDNLTFCAYYKAIINQIRTKAPHAMIFCLSEYDNIMKNTKTSYSQAVKDIAQLYHTNGDNLVYSLETGGVPITDMGIGGHYSTIGYAYIAKRVNDEVNKVIYANRALTEIKTFGVYNL